MDSDATRMHPCRVAIDGPRATITMDAPASRNALSTAMVDGILSGLRRAIDEDDVRVIVLTGSGSSFCSGADLKEQSSGAPQAAPAAGLPPFVSVLQRLRESPKPVVARVNGHVAGGGNGLVSACDLSIAAASAKFAFSEVRVGVAPAIISVVCLPRLRAGDAAELFLTGERIDADRARELGLVNRVVDEAGLDDAVDDLVERLLGCGPAALAATKSLLRRVPTMAEDDAFAWTAELSASLFRSPEAAEGMAAFLERRPPIWPRGRAIDP